MSRQPLNVAQKHAGMKLFLEGTTDDQSWGTYHSMVVDLRSTETIEQATQRAVDYLERQAMLWVKNYDPSINFRIMA